MSKMNYTKMQGVTEKLIDKFGFSSSEVTLTQKTGTPTNQFDPASGTTDHNVACVVLSLNSDDMDILVKGGATAIHKYKKILFSPLDLAVEINIGDKVTTVKNSVTNAYKIYMVGDITPADKTVLWKVYAEVMQ